MGPSVGAGKWRRRRRRDGDDESPQRRRQRRTAVLGVRPCHGDSGLGVLPVPPVPVQVARRCTPGANATAARRTGRVTWTSSCLPSFSRRARLTGRTSVLCRIAIRASTRRQVRPVETLRALDLEGIAGGRCLPTKKGPGASAFGTGTASLQTVKSYWSSGSKPRPERDHNNSRKYADMPKLDIRINQK